RSGGCRRGRRRARCWAGRGGGRTCRGRGGACRGRGGGGWRRGGGGGGRGGGRGGCGGGRGGGWRGGGGGGGGGGGVVGGRGVGEAVGVGVVAVQGTLTSESVVFAWMSSVRVLLFPTANALPKTRTWKRSVAEPEELTLLKVKVLRPVPVWLSDVASTVGVKQPEATRSSCGL